MSEGCWDHTKLQRRGFGIRDRVRRKASTIKNEIFIGETQRGA
jgi:hypothetical protein